MLWKSNRGECAGIKRNVTLSANCAGKCYDFLVRHWTPNGGGKTKKGAFGGLSRNAICYHHSYYFIIHCVALLYICCIIIHLCNDEIPLITVCLNDNKYWGYKDSASIIVNYNFTHVSRYSRKLLQWISLLRIKSHS